MNIDWGTLGEYLKLDHQTLKAMGVTAYTAIISQIIGVVVGLGSASMQRSRNKVARLIAGTYVWLVRGTPLIVQIFFIYYGTNIILGFQLIPRTVTLFGVGLPGAVVGGIAALSINEGAYMSEIIRASINSIDRGQLESAQSLGLRKTVAMRRIIWPQAARVIVPPLGNEFNNMLKSTSLLSFIGINELFNDAQVRYSATFQPVEYFMGVAIIYLALTTVWSFVQAWIERRLSAGYTAARPVENSKTRWATRAMGLKLGAGRAK